jgi:hypothetical protein
MWLFVDRSITRGRPAGRWDDHQKSTYVRTFIMLMAQRRRVAELMPSAVRSGRRRTVRHSQAWYATGRSRLSGISIRSRKLSLHSMIDQRPTKQFCLLLPRPACAGLLDERN